jgi:hypothetical protein
LYARSSTIRTTTPYNDHLPVILHNKLKNCPMLYTFRAEISNNISNVIIIFNNTNPEVLPVFQDQRVNIVDIRSRGRGPKEALVSSTVVPISAPKIHFIFIAEIDWLEGILAI